MDNKLFFTCLLVMAATTYLVRMVPFTAFRRKIESRRVKAFFDYIPYTVLSAMTFPAILYSTDSMLSAGAGALVAVILAYRGKSLLTVATVGDCDDSLCQIDESQSCHRFRIKSCWLSAVTTLADTLHDGNLCQQRHIHLLGQMLGTVFPENIILVVGQFCRCEPRHILNQTEYGHIHLLVAIHVDAFAGVGKSHALRCTHDDGTGDGKRL